MPDETIPTQTADETKPEATTEEVAPAAESAEGVEAEGEAKPEAQASTEPNLLARFTEIMERLDASPGEVNDEPAPEASARGKPATETVTLPPELVATLKAVGEKYEDLTPLMGMLETYFRDVAELKAGHGRATGALDQITGKVKAWEQAESQQRDNLIDTVFDGLSRDEYGGKDGKRNQRQSDQRVAVWKMAAKVQRMYAEAGQRCPIDMAIKTADQMYFKGAAPAKAKPETKPETKRGKGGLTIRPDQTRGGGNGNKPMTPKQEYDTQVSDFTKKMDSFKK